MADLELSPIILAPEYIFLDPTLYYLLIEDTPQPPATTTIFMYTLHAQNLHTYSQTESG